MISCRRGGIPEVLHGVGDSIAVKANVDAASGLATDAHVKENPLGHLHCVEGNTTTRHSIVHITAAFQTPVTLWHKRHTGGVNAAVP